MKIAGKKFFGEATRSLFKKPATVLYPSQKLPVPKDFRGAPVVNENTCIGCKICARECPAKAIEMVDVGAKMPRPSFYYDKCIFCAVCADACPKKSITITNTFEMGSPDRKYLYKMPGRPQIQEPGDKKVEDSKQE